MESNIVYSLIYIFSDDDTGTGGVFTTLDGAKSTGNRVKNEEPNYVDGFIIIKMTVDATSYDGEVVFDSNNPDVVN